MVGATDETGPSFGWIEPSQVVSPSDTDAADREGANTYACEHFVPSVLQSCDNCQTSSSQQAVHDETMMGSTVRWY